MKSVLTYYWDLLKSNFAFFPTMTMIVGMAAGAIFPGIEASIRDSFDLNILDSARASEFQLLQGLIGILATVTGVVLSIAMLVISQASGQFGPRIIRIFTDSQSTQLTLGLFIGTLAYCLLLLWQFNPNGFGSGKMAFCVTIALFLGMVSFVTLIGFVHNVTRLMRVQVVIQSIAHDLDSAISKNYLDEEPETAQEKQVTSKDQFQGGGITLTAPHKGYLQAILYKELVTIAAENNLSIQVECLPGNFVGQNHEIVRIFSEDAQLSKSVRTRILDCFLKGDHRTPRQDVECAIQELVEVAVKALSPGINDPFTAINAIDYLGAGLGALAGKRELPELLFDSEGSPRVLRQIQDFETLFDHAIDPLYHYGADAPLVRNKLIEMLRDLEKVLLSEERQTIINKKIHSILGN